MLFFLRISLTLLLKNYSQQIDFSGKWIISKKNGEFKICLLSVFDYYKAKGFIFQRLNEDFITLKKKGLKLYELINFSLLL